MNIIGDDKNIGMLHHDKGSADSGNHLNTSTPKKNTQELLDIRKKNLNNVLDFSHYSNKGNDLLVDIKKTSGLTGILIISENSGEIILNHGFSYSDEEKYRKISASGENIVVHIFDRPRKYRVILNNENGYLTQGKHIHDITFSKIKSFVQNKEQYLLKTTHIDRFRLNSIEGNRAHDNYYDYSNFIDIVLQRCIRSVDFHESQYDSNYIDNILKALDICRAIMHQGIRTDNTESQILLEKIHGILDGHVQRRVLHMVTTMLLASNENVNGSGYPFGFTKKEISLEGRIYAIIHVYEALVGDENMKNILQDGIEDGYLDGDITRIFFENLDCGGIVKSINHTNTPGAISATQMKRYKYFSALWRNVMSTTKDIQDIHYEARITRNSTEFQSTAFKKTNKLRLNILDRIDTRKWIVVGRHGETESDVPGGPPGGENELLTKEGKLGSIKKGIFFDQLHIKIFTSTFIRARQTAAIICQKVRGCVEDIVLATINNGGFQLRPCNVCPAIIPEISLENPTKNREDDRYDSLLAELLANNNIQGLREFLKTLISSPEELTYLFITHRDTARHLIILLENMFLQDGIFSHKRNITHDSLHIFYVRGGKLILGEDNRVRGPLFHIENWSQVLSVINLFSENVFGEIFFHLGESGTDLIQLHDKFLDFMDHKIEEDPDKVLLYIEMLSGNPLTRHFLDILKAEEVIF